jgi:hypothetical protein
MSIKLIMPCLLISAMAFSQASVSGYVYEDSNKNQKKENKEKELKESRFPMGSRLF